VTNSNIDIEVTKVKNWMTVQRWQNTLYNTFNRIQYL